KGLELIHEKGFIHRDIKPGNVFIRTDGSPVLLDFGSARQTRGRGEAQTLTNFVSPGYAPIEQYTSKSDRQGPWTDIYGMGATLYKAITGISPTTAIDRSEMIMNGIDDDYKSLSTLMKGRYSETFLAAIDHALAFNAENRPKTIAEWREEFGIDEEDIETMRAVVVDEGVKILGKSDTSIHSLEKATTKTVAKTQSDATTINVFGAAEELTTLALSTRASLLRWFRRHKYSAAGIAAAILVAAILLIPGSGEEEARQGATVAAAAPPGTARADSRETPAAKDAAIGSAHSMENRPKESAKPAPKAATRSAPTSVTEVVAAGQANTAPEATSAPETKAASEPKLPPVTTVASETKDATETKLPPVTTVAPEPATVPETKTAQKASVERVAAAGSDGENDSNAKRINRLLWRAKTDTRALRLTTPKGNNAYERYQEILSLDGDNEAARKGIQTLSDKYVELAYGAMDSGRRRLAWIYLSRARKLTPASPAIAKARVTLRKQVEQVEQTKQSKQIKPAKHIREAKQAEPQKEKGENSGYLINNVVNWFKNATKDKKDAKDAKSTK
ncbi:MAG: protein kinase, partial [Gammaproteobacteria bacterium]